MELEVAEVELLLALDVSEYITIALIPPHASLGAPAQATAAALDVSEGLRIELPQTPSNNQSIIHPEKLRMHIQVAPDTPKKVNDP